MKKKALALLTIAALSVSVAGCGKGLVERQPETTTAAATQKVTLSTAKTEATTKAQTTTKAEATTKAQATTKSETMTTASAQIAPERGTVADGKYTNTSIGLTIPLDKLPTVCNDEQIATLMGYGDKILSADGVATKEQLEAINNGTIYDMVAYLEDGQSNIIVIIENMKKTSKIVLTEEQYAAALKRQFATLSSIKYTSLGNDEQVKLGNNTYYVTRFDVNSTSKQEYYLKQDGDYMFYVIATYTDASKDAMKAIIDSIK